MKNQRDLHGSGDHMPKAAWVRAASAGVLHLLEDDLAAPKAEL